MNKIFSDRGEVFLKDKMSICIDDLANKIFKEASEEIDFFKKLIDYYIEIIFPHDYDKKLSHIEQDDNYDTLQSKLITFNKDNPLKPDSNASKIYEELHHALLSYSRGGLLGLWKHRDPTFWYPKVVLIESIGSKDDINALDEEVIIYRGTDINEFNSKKFSQPWTLNKKIAQNFAFVHYAGQPLYINTSRVVIQARINKNNIYFYDKNLREHEQEVVINPLKIIKNSIKLFEQKTLK